MDLETHYPQINDQKTKNNVYTHSLKCLVTTFYRAAQTKSRSLASNQVATATTDLRDYKVGKEHEFRCQIQT